MSFETLSSPDRSTLRIFRKVAAEARSALQAPPPDAAGFHVVGGYIEDRARLDHIRNLCIPVRRAYRTSDPVNLRRVVELLTRLERADLLPRLAAFERAYAPIQEELESVSILNERRVTHAELFEAWIDAKVFHDIPTRCEPYVRLTGELGKVVEGVGYHLAQRIGEAVVMLGDIAAAADRPPDDPVTP